MDIYLNIAASSWSPDLEVTRDGTPACLKVKGELDVSFRATCNELCLSFDVSKQVRVKLTGESDVGITLTDGFFTAVHGGCAINQILTTPERERFPSVRLHTNFKGIDATLEYDLSIGKTLWKIVFQGELSHHVTVAFEKHIHISGRIDLSGRITVTKRNEQDDSSDDEGLKALPVLLSQLASPFAQMSILK